MCRGLSVLVCSGLLVAVAGGLPGVGGGASGQEAAGNAAGFRIYKPLSGPGASNRAVSGSVLATATEPDRVAVRTPGGWEVWSLGDEGGVLDTGHLAWPGEKTARIEWENAEAEEIGVSARGELPWDATGMRHAALRLSDWLIARKQPVALPFLGGENIGFRFAAAGAVSARAVSGEAVEGTWWWSRGLLHVRLEGFDEVATYEWRPLARHVGWNDGMSAPVAAEAAARAPGRPEGASPPPRLLPGAAAVCNRDVLGALLKTATERSDVVAALGIEKETILLCRDRQQLVAGIFEAEKRLAELVAESRKPRAVEARPPAAVKTVAQLVAAQAAAPPVKEKPPRSDGDAAKNASGKGPPRRAAKKAAKPTWRWFSMLGREGRLVAGVTDGSGAWFVAEGERLPGAGVVKRISARPAAVEVAGVGILGWVEGPPRPGEKNNGRAGGPGGSEPRPMAGDGLDRVIERTPGGSGGPKRGGGRLKGRADTVDGDTLRLGGVRIRLWGIDAPEKDQTCRAEGLEWACGRLAEAALRSRATDISCREKGRDGYGRVLAVCFDGGADVNAWLVAEGWALAYRGSAGDYADEEEAARAARKGMHRGEFIQPWEWRRGERFGQAGPDGPTAGSGGEGGAGRLPPLPGRGDGR